MPAWSALARSAALAAVLAVSAIGCATRSPPTQFPAASAASPRADEAPPAHVTGALRHEPPLPGEPVTQWPGLRDDARPVGHGGHHGH